MTWLYLMKNRSEVFSCFTAFCAEIQNQFHTSVRILRSDNAKEYFSDSFNTYMTAHGIIHQSSCVDTSSQNGVAERKNRHLLETARALLFQNHVPKHFWAEAVSTACFLINRMPSAVLHGEIPFSILFPTKPLFPIEPRIFGCTCFARDVRPHVTKLDPKSVKCVFLGYSRVQKGYQCYCPSLNKFLVFADVTFLEHCSFFPASFKSVEHTGEQDDVLLYRICYPSPHVPVIPSPPPPPPRPLVHRVYARRQNPDKCPLPVSSSELDLTTSDNDLPIALRKGKRQCTYPISCFVSYRRLSPSSYSFLVSLCHFYS